jgi:hypothetical protein
MEHFVNLSQKVLSHTGFSMRIDPSATNSRAAGTQNIPKQHWGGAPALSSGCGSGGFADDSSEIIP